MVAPRIIVGRYALYHALASGGTATVYLGRLHGSGGFTRTVAVKRLHPGLVKDRTFAAMFLDEARLAARIRHPNVVPIVDVVHSEDELFLVMEYVAGESLHTLLKLARTRPTPVAVDVAAGLVAGVLHGLHAAHEATSDDGEPLHLVHRDVSPHNILVGADGVARVLDFGIAKARGRAQSTSEGQLKGKIAYMAPEQLDDGNVGRRVDVYAAGVVLWEILAGRRLFRADSDVILFARVLGGRVEAPSTHRSDLPAEIEDVVMRGLAQKPEERFATAREFALAIEQAVPIASAAKIADWVETVATDSLIRRADLVRLIEGDVETQDAISDRAVTVKTPGPPDSGTPVENTLPSVDQQIGVRAASESSTNLALVDVDPKQAERPWARYALWIAIALCLAGAAALTIGPRDTDGQASAPSASQVPITPTVVPTPAKTASAAPPPTASASARAVTRVPRGKPPPSAPSASARPQPARDECDPPYTLDERGIQRIKPQCL